ncbi:hypothetical protein HLK59_17115 [Streptomyces sp. S3(2020)]|uniref:DUF6985 domain-containing protein n=1 Tax=Streptomyces sp. S3(2020) TaxID=2732044 RepID=UPI0014882108|nr:hypothetical protein [Streptomyces sp. S3(2020)]NNN32053.1 hypothetical protein [Streptomyces sp. S3(2020)]
MTGPDFSWDEDAYAWTARITLPPEAWAAPTEPVPLHYAPEGREEHPLDDAELASATWAVERLPALLGAARRTVHAHAVRTLEPQDQPQDLAAASALDDGVRVDAVYVHPVSRDRVPYVGVAFSCPWDEEHGLGVLLHGTRVVDIGGADTAFLLWIAERDATDPRTGLDEALLGHWDSSPFEYGVMEASEFELRADGRGWSLLANLAGEYVTRFSWRCPDAGVLELRDEDGLVSRHPYVVTTAPVTSVTFEEPVEFGHQYAKSG